MNKPKRISEPKFHHYIPRYYLDGFVEPAPKSSRIWVYRKDTGLCFPTTPKRFGGTTDFYTIVNPDGTKDRSSMEEFFNLEVEIPAQPALDKIRQGTPLSNEDKKALTRYLIFLLKRVPKTREKSKRKSLPEVAAKLREKIKGEAIVGMIDDPERAEWYQGLYNATEIYMEKWITRTQNPTEVDNMLVGILRHDSLRAMEALYRMAWTFVSAPNAFITNDAPFAFEVRKGIGKSDSQVTVPLCKDVALICNPPTGLPDQYRKATIREVKQINRRTVSIADQFVVAPYKDLQWLQNLIRRPHVKFKDVRP